MLDYKNILSAAQYKAVSSFQGASLVIAGAGSGKTRVLTYRIAYMIENGVLPYTILSLTFTNKAAGEMRNRITEVVTREKSQSIWMGTFHSIFSRILRKEAAAIGFTDSYTIYEPNDCKNLIKTIVREMSLDEKKYDPKIISSRISKAKNNLTTPQIYASNSALVGEDIKRGQGEFHNIYRMYMIRCKQNNAMDFDDLLLYTNILFRDNPAILATYQDKFKYILVDEYQDTNSAQYLIVKKLAEKHGNICVVGDDAQSIYSFRGAKIENILKFQKDYPSATVVALEENYRSTQTIVNAASCVISNNTEQLKKTIFSKQEEGDLITLRRAFTDKEEAIEIRKIIEQQNRDGIAYKDMAILYRTNAQSKVLEDQLRLRQIPYKIHKGFSFYQHAEIKSILAYARLISNSSDDEALKRVINFPTRGIGNTSLEKISAFAKERNISVWDAISLFSVEEMGVKGGAVRSIKSFVELIEKSRESAKTMDAFNLIYNLVSDSGILAQYKNTNDPEKESAYQNIEELVNSLKQQCETYEKENQETLLMPNWIQEVILLTSEEQADKDGGENKVTMMTIHSAKGLEYNTIFIAGVEEGMFPAQRSVESQSDLEEERRLFYVAVTRAVKKLVISYSLSRYKWGEQTNTIPSRFISEISGKYYDSPEFMTAKDAYNDMAEENISSSTGSYSAKVGSPYEANKNKTTYYKERYTTRDAVPKAMSKPVPRPANMTQISASRADVVSISEGGGLAIGDSVKHERFGNGVIKSMEQTSTDTRICVDFEQSGEKNLLMKFAKLKKI